LSAITQRQEATSIAVVGAITLAWLIVLIVECICVPLLIIVLIFYLCPGCCTCCWATGAEDDDAPALDVQDTVIFDEPAYTTMRSV
jgi:hypothetical protein